MKSICKTKNTSANEEFIMLSIGERKISNVQRTMLFFCCWTQLNVLKTSHRHIYRKVKEYKSFFQMVNGNFMTVMQFLILEVGTAIV